MDKQIQAFCEEPQQVIDMLAAEVKEYQGLDGSEQYVDRMSGAIKYIQKMLHPAKSLKIVGVAIRADNGLVYSMKAPARHVDLKRLMREDGYEGPTEGNERDGFLLSNGSFCRRVAAGALARRTGQLQSEDKKFVHGSHFTSEDLW